MNQYIKVNELMDLINNQADQIDKDYEEEKISTTSHIAMIGTLEVLKRNINSQFK